VTSGGPVGEPPLQPRTRGRLIPVHPHDGGRLPGLATSRNDATTRRDANTSTAITATRDWSTAALPVLAPMRVSPRPYAVNPPKGCHAP